MTSSAALAVVTGASSGIGAAFATALAGRGYRVLAVARRADRLAALEQDARDRAAPGAGRIVPLALDLTAEDAVGTLVARAAELGPVELLVSNAGRGAHGRAWTIPPQTTSAVVKLNVGVGVDLVSAVLPGMVERGRGGLIVVTSAGGLYPTPYLAAYGASKAFLLSFTEALATELRGTGVRAMALCPGPTTTEFGEVAGMAELMVSAPGLMSPDDVVAAALRAWDRRRTVCLPGRSNATMTAVLARLPRPVTRRAMERALRR